MRWRLTTRALLALGLAACGGKDDAGTDSRAADADGDGFSVEEDCDDGDARSYPGAEERCDGADQDCDGAVDEGVTELWYPDDDGDGFGRTEDAAAACSRPDADHVQNEGDCDDGDRDIRPGAEERCDGLDRDCDGAVDEGVTVTVYPDGDGDGYGRSAEDSEACEAGEGEALEGGDCDDEDPEANPGAQERCDEVDNDCDRQVDEAGATWYADDDYDGYGDPSEATESCDPPAGAVDNGDDCDDSDAATWPGAPDGCGGDDNDCDGVMDEDFKAGWMMTSVDTNAGYTYEIDVSSGSTVALAALSSTSGINTMDVSEDGRALVQSSGERHIYEIDVCTGALTSVGATGVGAMCGIAFGPGGQLYGLDSTNEQLVRIDASTGAATAVGPLGFSLGSCGLSYDCANDILYGADATTDQIFTVDPSTGRASNFVSTGVPFQSVGLEFDVHTGLLYGSTRYDLYSVDPATGSTSYIGPLGGSNIDDLAWHPTCN